MKSGLGVLTILIAGSLSLHAQAQVTVVPVPPTQSAVSSSLPAEARSLLQEARAAAQRGRATGTFSADQPDWRSAIQNGEGARALAPESLEVLRLLGETYSAVSWDSRAWDAWDAYLAADGPLDETVRRGVSRAGQGLGFARYTGGDLTGAAEIFGRVLELESNNVNALTWLGRIALENGRSAEAESYWQRVLTLRPGNRTARYYLQRAEQQRTFGAEASGAFNDGLAAYNGNRKAAALEAFSHAARANPDFEEALSWAGRVALELGRPEAAKTFWQALVRRNPQDTRASYFLSLAEAQEHWGSVAGRAFYAGQDLYNRGQVRAAAERFVAATEANPQYPAAASWAARSLQESGQAGRAAPYWRRVVTLNPDDASAKFFLEAAQNQQRLGSGAASAFNQGVQAYQEADLAAAETAFNRATQENPTYAEAWGWLGRLAFEGQRYPEAASAYTKAVELEPDNTTFSFFLSEAQRLNDQ